VLFKKKERTAQPHLQVTWLHGEVSGAIFQRWSRTEDIVGKKPTEHLKLSLAGLLNIMLG
jgi:hypothetical protein